MRQGKDPGGGSRGAASCATPGWRRPRWGCAGPLAAPAIGASRGRRVAVLGGGMAGLTAAHELVERGFKVDVYEPVALGGKARSIDVPGSGEGRPHGRCPGEHGFRFFPGFYHHIPDSMRRTPDGKNANGVYDNLARTPPRGARCAPNGRADAQLFGMIPDPVAATTPQGLRRRS